MTTESIENEIKRIPGNEAVLEKLYELLGSGEAIALVGAGASAELWPLWDRFLKDFIEHGRKNGKIDKSEAEYLIKESLNTPLETAQQLRNKIGEALYFEYLQETFSDKISTHTGGSYTRNQKALMQLPIRNYMTLNYDAGLTNARAALYPQATTSYFFWDQEEARRILERKNKRQILHAHGRHDRAESIILTMDDYCRCYNCSPFVRLLNNIFAFEKLLFVGFGMTDPYIKQLNNKISEDYKKGPLRHVALVGLDEKDLQTSDLLRERVEMIYGARILFYPACDNHKALQSWFSIFVDRFSQDPKSTTAESVKPLVSPVQVKRILPDRFIHQPTDDANFKGRSNDFKMLNLWANDPDTRTIAITGIGGQGKTALTGRWLKNERSPELAGTPVFYWSFYEDLDVGKFMEQVIGFCKPILRIEGEMEVEPISCILEIIRRVRLLLVLDGLEVMQETVDSPSHGRINHPLLDLFLQQWVRNQHKGLMLLTSRFRFPQLERYSGAGFHHLELLRLSMDDSIALLEKLGVRGERKHKELYVEKLNGHPLALRVLAATVKRCCHGDLEQFKGSTILDEAGEDDKLTQKLKHLLSFYEELLKNGQKELLGIISLFKRPVEISSFIALLKGMKSLENTPLSKASEAEIKKQLDTLLDDFLIEMTHEGSITTHPVIRDYFRTGLKLPGSRREVADFLKARPGEERPKTIEEVRDLVEAVQLLCDEGEFTAAHYLLKARLAAGGYGFNVFKNLPAITEGLECSLAFVGDKMLSQRVEKESGMDTVAVHCSWVSIYNYYFGNLPQALEWRQKVLEIRHKLQDDYNQAGALSSIAEIQCSMGEIQQAIGTISQALIMLYEMKGFDDLMVGFANKGFNEFLLGNSSQAFQEFEISFLYEQKQRPYEKHLYSLPGINQAKFCIRLNEWDLFDSVNSWNIRSCEQYHWNDKWAICHSLQAWSEICRNCLPQSEKSLAIAEKILRTSGMVQETCLLDLVWSLLSESKGEYPKGLQRVNDSLHLCADKGYRLLQADHLVVRGRLYLLQAQKATPLDTEMIEKAMDDGKEALSIAEKTGYVWAKVDALDLLGMYHTARSKLPGLKPEEEIESAERYSRESASIKEKLFLTEQQMKDLKIQAKEEFDRQIAAWEK